jgi:c-di-GMP-binding flagellar brake protein YcgR
MRWSPAFRIIDMRSSRKGGGMASILAANEPKVQQFEFESMNLQVGGRIQFITHRSIKPVQHFSTLIGYVRDEYLIVKTPFDSGAPIVLNDGDKLTIRVFSGVTVCSFSASVMRLFARPMNYVHLSFPTSIQGTSLRAAMRVKVDIPAQLSCGEVKPISVFIVNLSVSGALIESPRRLDEDDAHVHLSFTLITQGRHQVIINTQASIRNVNILKPATETSREVFTYGVQFIDLEPTHYTMLQNLTYEALIADRQKIV